MSNKVNYWQELSDYDIDTAQAMFECKRFLYVGFMAHQAIEKILKAYFVKINNEQPPFSHSLSFLAKKSDIYQLFSSEQKELIDMLEPLNIEARYPTNKDSLIKSLTEKRCLDILSKARELQVWIKQKL